VDVLAQNQKNLSLYFKMILQNPIHLQKYRLHLDLIL
jgi:hypothetical protein